MSEEAGLRRKLKFAIGKAKCSKNFVKTEDKRQKGSKGNGKVNDGKNNMVEAATDRELHERKNGGRKNFRPRAEKKPLDFVQEGYEGEIEGNRYFGPGNLDGKRKRIYADRDLVSRNVEVPIRKSVSRDVRYQQDCDDSIEKKRSTNRKPCDGELHSRKKFSARGRDSLKDKLIEGKSSKRERLPLRVHNGREKSAIDGKHSFHRGEDNDKSEESFYNKSKTKFKTIDRKLSAKLSGGRDTSANKNAKFNMDSRKPVDPRQTKYHARSIDKSAKKMRPDRKGLDDDYALTEGRPKKKKRVIRIDPYDISNKRLDDSISITESTTQKVDLEKNVELSSNAKFRAIIPSPSILSFVEDNLLGRRRLIELQRSGYNTKLSAPLDDIPFCTSSERGRIEDNVFRNKLSFFAAAKISSSFPPADLPEIAFAGRSNVGKSSLLNAITRQWGVVRTSDKPGLTQTINFFNLGSKLCLVDLPGYGFAYAKEEVKDAWEELVKEYVSTRAGLKRVCLLIDTKWGMKPRDRELVKLMESSQTKYQIVLTKTDVVFPIDVARRAMQIEEMLTENKSVVQPVMMVSSKSGAGIRSLRTVLAKITRFAKP